MTIARSSGVLLGTDETTGLTITNTTRTASSEKDFLGDDTSAGEIEVFLKFTSTVTAGTVDVDMSGARVTGQDYTDVPRIVAQIVPNNGTQRVSLGRYPIGRYGVWAVTNNATGASITNVTLGYEEFKYS